MNLNSILLFFGSFFRNSVLPVLQRSHPVFLPEQQAEISEVPEFQFHSDTVNWNRRFFQEACRLSELELQQLRRWGHRKTTLPAAVKIPAGKTVSSGNLIQIDLPAEIQL